MPNSGWAEGEKAEVEREQLVGVAYERIFEVMRGSPFHFGWVEQQAIAGMLITSLLSFNVSGITDEDRVNELIDAYLVWLKSNILEKRHQLRAKYGYSNEELSKFFKENRSMMGEAFKR